MFNFFKVKEDTTKIMYDMICSQVRIIMMVG